MLLISLKSSRHDTFVLVHSTMKEDRGIHHFDAVKLGLQNR